MSRTAIPAYLLNQFHVLSSTIAQPQIKLVKNVPNKQTILLQHLHGEIVHKNYVLQKPILRMHDVTSVTDTHTQTKKLNICEIRGPANLAWL